MPLYIVYVGNEEFGMQARYAVSSGNMERAQSAAEDAAKKENVEFDYGYTKVHPYYDGEPYRC